VIALHGLRHRFPGSAPLSFPDFESDVGSTVVLRGPSGSGKSTLIALAAGLLQVQAGSLRVAGAELAAMSARACDAWRAATLGVMPQRLHLSAGLNVFDNLALAYMSARMPLDAKRIDALLAELDIADLSDRTPHTLSVGQMQRVALARALLRRPPVPLVDEPTANLDDASAAGVIALLGAAARQSNATLVIATHDRRATDTLRDAAVLNLAAATSAA
jgi:putative ABC transport system ATP-binding protein